MAALHDPTPVELELFFDYLDGKLEAGERFRFEEQLARDEALAARFAKLLETDTILRSAAPARLTVDAPAPRHAVTSLMSPARILVIRGVLALAVAASLVPAVVWWRSSSAPDYADTVGMQVALLESDYERRRYAIDILGLDPSLRIPQPVTRGAGESAGEFVDAVARREKDRTERALAAPRATLPAEYFVVPFTSSVECSAVVLLIGEDGTPTRVHPQQGADGSIATRFAPGVVHTLPRAIVGPTADPGSPEPFDYSPGYQLPADAKSMTVLFALRAMVPEDRLWHELDARIEASTRSPSGDPGATAASLEGWFAEHHFVVRRFVVEEPPK